MNRQSFFLIAGEASGDTLGAELILSIRAASRGGRYAGVPLFFGAGGPRMTEAGMESNLDLTPHAVVGIVEVLKNYRKFRRFFNEMLELVCRRQPDAVILIDYPGFNLRFVHALRKRLAKQSPVFSSWKPKIVFYVSPQIWAWHESRVHQIAAEIDLMLVIFPFEVAWYAKRVPDFPVKYVGHPLLDRFGARSTVPVRTQAPYQVVLLPGSRVKELRNHLPVLLATLELLRPRVEVTLVLPSERLRGLAEEQLRSRAPSAIPIKVQIGGLSQALARADLALASSGTVTMECAWFGVPTLVLYRTSWSTYQLGKRFIKVPYLAMPNLLAKRIIYPEFIQHEATAAHLAETTNRWLECPAERTIVQFELSETLATLGAPGASSRAAQAVLDLLAGEENPAA